MEGIIQIEELSGLELIELQFLLYETIKKSVISGFGTSSKSKLNYSMPNRLFGST